MFGIGLPPLLRTGLHNVAAGEGLQQVSTRTLAATRAEKRDMGCVQFRPHGTRRMAYGKV
jgi:hypothetical protein